MNVYPFIEAENAASSGNSTGHSSGNVRRACTLLKVSRAAYYAHRVAAPSTRDQDDTRLTEEIIAIHDESNRTYGAPRLHAELRNRGRRHSRKRVARLLRAAGRAGRTPKRWRTTTVPDPTATVPVDLIRRDFSCSAIDINQRWCGDITYIHTWEGWLYLATVIDLSSRRVVGWATADHLRTNHRSPRERSGRDGRDRGRVRIAARVGQVVVQHLGFGAGVVQGARSGG